MSCFDTWLAGSQGSVPQNLGIILTQESWIPTFMEASNRVNSQCCDLILPIRWGGGDQHQMGFPEEKQHKPTLFPLRK